MSNSRAIIRQRISIVLIAGLILTNAAYAAVQDAFWPQFHGPNRDNHSTETGLLKKWPAEGPELLWTAKGLGQGYSSVSIGSGRIYTAGNIEKETVITALNVDGEVLWQVPNGKAWTKDRPGPARHPNHRRGSTVPPEPSRKPRLPERQDRRGNLAVQHTRKVQEQDVHVGPGRVPADRRG